MSGAIACAIAFDRAYIAHELAFHPSAIDAVTGTLLPAAQNPELKTCCRAPIWSVAPIS